MFYTIFRIQWLYISEDNYVMDNTAILNDKALKHTPPLFTLLLFLVLGCPTVALYYWGIDVSQMMNKLTYYTYKNIPTNELATRTYCARLLLQCFDFSIALMTTLLALAQYRLSKDKITLLIGLTVLFSSAMDIFNTQALSHVLSFFGYTDQLETSIWTRTSIVSGLTLGLGLVYLLHKDVLESIRLSLVLLVPATLLYLSFILYPTISLQKPLPISYELICLAVYLPTILLIYPQTYKAYPTLLTHCIFYMAVAQMGITSFLILFSHLAHEITYNITYFLKLMTYFIPFSYLMMHSIFSYKTILKAQQELQQNQEKLKYLAAHDELTNVYNKREFENLLDKTIANYAREQDSFALFLIDIDDFKSINDTWGHAYGDHFLKHFTEQLTQLTRKGDIIARIGGDEFTIIMPKLHSAKSAHQLAQRIIQGLTTAYIVNEKCLLRTVSIGIAIYPKHGTNTEELLRNADLAMYSAKKSGKNKHQLPKKTNQSIQDNTERLANVLDLMH